MELSEFAELGLTKIDADEVGVEYWPSDSARSVAITFGGMADHEVQQSPGSRYWREVLPLTRVRLQEVVSDTSHEAL